MNISHGALLRDTVQAEAKVYGRVCLILSPGKVLGDTDSNGDFRDHSDERIKNITGGTQETAGITPQTEKPTVFDLLQEQKVD